jgi:hypothetical protein
MTDTITKPKIKDKIKVEQPRLHKVILVDEMFMICPRRRARIPGSTGLC